MCAEIVSRAEAKAQGLKSYFTGKPCKHGHVAARMILNCVCLECKRAFNRRNAEKLATKARHYRAKNRNKIRCADYRRTYGISLQEYKALVDRSKGACDICRTPLGEEGIPRGRLFVDHCHTTGRVRGVLCGHCNTGLGMFFDTPYLMRAAAAYLEQRS